MTNKTVKNNLIRQSNFELLRIIAMLFIVMRHFALYGGLDETGSEIMLNKVFITLVGPFGKLGVDIFILISGYFLAEKSKVTVRKTVKLWSQVFFYTFSIFIVSVIINPDNFSVSGLFENVFPVAYPGLWFVKTYFMFFLLTPFMNMVLQNLSKRSHETVIVLFFVLWCIVPTNAQDGFQLCDLLWFCYLFVAASFIRKYEDEIKLSPVKCFVLFAVVFVILFLYKLAGMKFDVIMEIYKPYTIDSVFNLLCSLFLFMGFKNINIKNKKVCIFINTVASATFGVYLIHENRFIRNILWQRIFNPMKFVNSSLLVPYAMAATLIVFAVCICIDLIRMKFIEKPFMKAVGKYEPKMNYVLVKMFDYAVFCCRKVKIFLKQGQELQ